MNPLSRKELHEVRGWVKKHATYDGNMMEDRCCSLLSICKHHADKQEVYAKQIPPKTVERLLDMIEEHGPRVTM